jgi:accessory gene regulator protein AgrB
MFYIYNINRINSNAILQLEANNVRSLQTYYDALYPDLKIVCKHQYFERRREVYEYLLFIYIYLLLLTLINQMCFDISMLENTNISPDALCLLSQMDEARKKYWLEVV